MTFGELEPLVSLMQETSPDRLLPLLIEKMKAGTSLRSLVSAGALANVRAFAGQDYTGYHTFMALVPALQMAGEMCQSVRYCLQVEQSSRDRSLPPSPIREVLPRLLDEYKLLGKPLGERPADDAWVEQLAATVVSRTREQAAESVAAALADGIDPEAVGEAISLAANQLVLHDPGRLEKYGTPQKPPGCVHGDSVEGAGPRLRDHSSLRRAEIARTAGVRSAVEVCR